MEEPSYQARRATLEDLPELRSLWESARLPVEEFEKRFTEFQVAVDAQGLVAAAIALQIDSQNGLIHSETFRDLNEAEQVRPVLWNRLLNISRNHGLIRLWTRIGIVFFREKGFSTPEPLLASKRLASFGEPGEDWLCLKLREELQSQLTMEQEYEMYLGSSQESGEKLVRQAQALRIFAYALLALVVIGASLVGLFIFRRLPKNRR